MSQPQTEAANAIGRCGVIGGRTDELHFDLDIPSSALLATLAAPTHYTGLIQLQDPHPGLTVVRFEGEEHLCGDTRFDIDCLATDATLDLLAWLEQGRGGNHVRAGHRRQQRSRHAVLSEGPSRS